MRDANDLVKLIKKASVEAVEQSKPTGLTFGKVVSSSPLKINVEQKMTLSSAQIILTRAVTNYKTNVDDTQTEQNQETTANKTITVYNELKIGDEVVMLRMQGGQKYLVLDRVVGL